MTPAMIVAIILSVSSFVFGIAVVVAAENAARVAAVIIKFAGQALHPSCRAEIVAEWLAADAHYDGKPYTRLLRAISLVRAGLVLGMRIELDARLGALRSTWTTIPSFRRIVCGLACLCSAAELYVAYHKTPLRIWIISGSMIAISFPIGVASCYMWFDRRARLQAE